MTRSAREPWPRSAPSSAPAASRTYGVLNPPRRNRRASAELERERAYDLKRAPYARRCATS